MEKRIAGHFYDNVEESAQKLQDVCHRLAKDSGWWTDLQTGETTITGSNEDPKVNVPEKLCLIHSEVSEGMEGFRKSLMDDKLPDRPMLEVELADVVIRCFDLAGGIGLDLAGAIAAKLYYNQSREDHKIANRKAENGKKF